MNHGRKLRIGIIGAGSIVKQRHLPALKQLPDVEITAVCNSTYESSQHFCEEHLPSATPFKNWADVLALNDLDIVWVGTTPYMHAPITISALEAGKHVFCQARMAMNLPDAEEMFAAAQARLPQVTMLCPPPHGLRGGRVFADLLANGVIGEIYHMHLRSFTSQFLDPSAPAHWRQRVELSGLNVLTLGIYVEVLQRWFGPISKVSASGRVVIPIRHGYEVQVPDVLSVLGTFSNDAQITMDFSGVAAFAPGDRLDVYGSKGHLAYDFSSDRIELGTHSDRALQEVPISPEAEGHWTVEEDFVKAVRNPSAPRPRPSFADGVAYMRVVHAVADSARQQRVIEIR